jgi:Zn-dependent M28 family amino/carboxypeptidase
MSPADAGKAIHPGADDNASGTAGVIELARRFAAQPGGRRGILFLCFAGEELGLLGSSFYVHNPALPSGNAVAMINLDMIGRMRDRKVLVGGSATGSGLRELVERSAAEANLLVDLADTTGYGSSDHTAFTTLEIPVLFFFTGLHADYHRPSDTWEKIDAPATATLLEMIARIAQSLRDGYARPVFIRTLPAG